MRAMINAALLSMLAATSLNAAAAGESSVAYSIATLTSLTGQAVNIHSLTTAGLMTGSSTFGQANPAHAFLYAGGPVTDLGALAPGLDSVGYSVNQLGQVAGSAGMADGTRHAFRYGFGRMSDLGTMGYANSEAYGINFHGNVVGEVYNADFRSRAFVYENGAMKELGTLGGDSSRAAAINDAGQIVGAAATLDDAYHAFLYANGRMSDLGTLGGYASMATDINQLGQVVGDSITADGSYASFIYTGGFMTDLGAPAGRAVGFTNAHAVNNFGVVVGSLYERFIGDSGFVWQNGQMQNLNELIDPAAGWHIVEAVDVNDQGQIAAYGCIGQTCDSLLLTPVPEPAPWAMLLLGLGWVSAARWRNRRS